MPEGDTIAYAAHRLRPILLGAAPEIHARHGSLRGWDTRLTGRTIQAIDTYGKHLFLRFDGDLTIHSHLRMTGSWHTGPIGKPWRRAPHRAWLILRARGHEAVQFDGPLLELMTGLRSRIDPHIAQLGPDILADHFDETDYLRRLREDDPTRPIGDALLDQRIIAGLGNIWRAEACFEARLSPWKPTAQVTDEQALTAIRAVRPRMADSGRGGTQMRTRLIYRQPRCANCRGPIQSRGMGDDNRTAYWCPRCQR